MKTMVMPKGHLKSCESLSTAAERRGHQTKYNYLYYSLNPPMT